MTAITWDATAERLYETGVDHGVLYPFESSTNNYPSGVPWNGLVTVTESPSGAEAKPVYADNTKYLNLVSNEEFGGTIEAFTYPDEFVECDGGAEPTTGVKLGQQTRKTFGLAYRTVLGNDVDGNDLGYKLHLIYGALAAPSEKPYGTINDSPEAITFSWAFTTTPINVNGYRPVSSITIDSTKVAADKLALLEATLFGGVGTTPQLPLPGAVITALNSVPTAISFTSIPTTNATGVAITADIVLTFANAIVEESVGLVTAAGVYVPVTKTLGTGNTVLTLNPDSNLTASSTVYIVTVAGVVDTFGQVLADTAFKFTTVP